MTPRAKVQVEDGLLFRLTDSYKPARKPGEFGSLFEALKRTTELVDGQGGSWLPNCSTAFYIRLIPVWSAHAPDEHGHTLTLHSEKLQLMRVGGGYEKLIEAADGGYGRMDGPVTDPSDLPTPGLVAAVSQERLLAEVEYQMESTELTRHLLRQFQVDAEKYYAQLNYARSVFREMDQTRASVLSLEAGSKDLEKTLAVQGQPGRSERDTWDECAFAFGALVRDAVRTKELAAQREAMLKEYIAAANADSEWRAARIADRGTQTDPDDIMRHLLDSVVIDLTDEMLLEIVREAINESREDAIAAMMVERYIPRRLQPLIDIMAIGRALGDSPGRIRDHPQHLRVIEKIYESKIAADATALRAGLPRLDLAAHVIDYLMNTFGLRGLAGSEVIDLMASCRAYQQHCSATALFMRHLEDYPTELLQFHLYCYKTARSFPSGSTYRLESSQVVLISKPYAIFTLRQVLEGLEQPLDDALMRKRAEVGSHRPITRHEAEQILLSLPLWAPPPQAYLSAFPSVANQVVMELHELLRYLCEVWLTEETVRDTLVSDMFLEHCSDDHFKEIDEEREREKDLNGLPDSEAERRERKKRKEEPPLLVSYAQFQSAVTQAAKLTAKTTPPNGNAEPIVSHHMMNRMYAMALRESAEE